MADKVLGLLLLLAVVSGFVWLVRRAWRATHRLVRWSGATLAALGAALASAVLVLALVGTYTIYSPRGNPTGTIQLQGAAARGTLAERVARGEHLARVVCAQCHSTTGDVPLSGGRDLSEEIPIPLGSLTPANLTPVGRIGTWSDADIARAMREGADPARRLLPVMASQHFRYLGDEDLASIIAYLRSQPAVGAPTPPARLNLLAAIMVGAGLIPVPAVPTTGPSTAPPKAPTAAYGAYLVGFVGCRDCHGEQLRGSTGGLAPKGPSLFVVRGWTEAQFASALRTGVTWYGKKLDPTKMPWQALGRMDDVALAAAYAYLKGLR